MEYRISDLLDEYQDLGMDIAPHPDASPERIKELTMRKIHQHNAPRRRGLKTISRILLIAAVLASLAVPVMAATGFHFTQWVEELFHHETADYDHSITRGKHWEVSGWVLSLSAQNANAQSMTVRCADIGIPEKQGVLTAKEDYWIEKWNGDGYERLSDAVYAEEAHSIPSQDTVCWDISWADTYGQLPSGHYRLGKTFLYTDHSGQTEEVTAYTKFRVLLQEMEGYVETCQAAFDALKNRESYHLSFSYYPPDGETIQEGRYHHYTTQYWKYGEDCLRHTSYIAEDGTVIARRGNLYRDGVGYDLDWTGESVLSPLAQWGGAHWFSFTGTDPDWAVFTDPGAWADSIGEVWADNGVIGLIWGSHGARDDEWYNLYTEMRYFFDDAGALTDIRVYYTEDLQCSEEDLRLDYSVELHATSAEEIRQVIEAQDVSRPAAFSWAEESKQQPMVKEAEDCTDFVKTQGFVNTQPGLISTPMEAVEAAMRECTLSHQMASRVWYDPGADMWKVKIYWSQLPDYQYIYLDGRGVTRMIVSHQTVNIGG